MVAMKRDAKGRSQRRWPDAVLTAGAVAAVLAALVFGGPVITPGDAVAWLAGHGDATVGTVLLEVRLPRVALALAVGAALAIAGAALQSLLANPLADPFLLGISGGGAAAATAAFALLPAAALALVPALAMG